MEAAKLFQSLECGDEDVLGTVELPEGQRPAALLAGAELKEEERAEIAELRGETTAVKPPAAAGSAKAGPQPLESTTQPASCCIVPSGFVGPSVSSLQQATCNSSSGKPATLGGYYLFINQIGTPSIGNIRSKLGAWAFQGYSFFLQAVSAAGF